ncbi:MAG: hypothetical protein L0Y44_10570 [Phycisphaerales bacterium]|nr:hypothetical protein [Phycisphaerales bacterium]MCI0631081.1 hypothetical protein [Phycisphaerales bacterium]MCI0674424.1 hypothetical protein [Phycisphaerales bacterium]
MNPFRFGILSSMAVCALGAVLIGSIARSESQEKAPKAEDKAPKAQLMFVQVAEDLTSDPAAKTIRLVKVHPQTLYFSDRPVRIAGHLKMAEYLEEWTSKAGKDNFGADPPNAALSVYEPGQPDSTLVVVEITNPVVDGADLIYNYKIIDGEMPASGGQTALFIDWVGVGGGVGAGYHGVGVGARGVGVR